MSCLFLWILDFPRGLNVSCGWMYFDNQKRYVPLNPFQWGNGNTDWGCDNFAAQVCAEAHAGSVCVVLSLKDLVSCGRNKPRVVSSSAFRRAPLVQDSFSLSVAEGKTDFNTSKVKRLVRRLRRNRLCARFLSTLNDKVLLPVLLLGRKMKLFQGRSEWVLCSAYHLLIWLQVIIWLQLCWMQISGVRAAIQHGVPPRAPNHRAPALLLAYCLFRAPRGIRLLFSVTFQVLFVGVNAGIWDDCFNVKHLSIYPYTCCRLGGIKIKTAS